MLKLFKKSRSDSNYQIVNIVLLIFFLVVLFPVVPICLILIALCYIVDEDDNNLLYGALIFAPSLMIPIFLFVPNFAIVPINTGYVFGTEFLKIMNDNISYMLKGDIWMMLKSYSNYSFYSWILIVMFSFYPAGYFLFRMNKFRKLEKVGVTNLDTKIKKLNIKSKPNNPLVSNTSKNTSTLIGYNQNKKAVYCEDDIIPLE